MVHGRRRHDRQVVGRLQRAPDRRPRAARAPGGDQRLLDRRPLRRRRPLHRRLRLRRLHAVVGLDDARVQRPASRPGGGRGGLARAVARAPGADSPVRRGVALAPAPRRVLEAGLGLRGLRRDPLPGLHGRRLGRRLLERDPALPGRLRGAPEGPDRPVGTPLPARRAARARDRLPAGVAALVGPVAEGDGDRDHGGADAPGLDARPGPAAPELPGAAGPLGGRARLASAELRDTQARAHPRRARAGARRPRRARAARLRRARPRERHLGRVGLGRRLRARPAGGGRPLALHSRRRRSTSASSCWGSRRWPSL